MDDVLADILLPPPVAGPLTYAVPRRLSGQIWVGSRALVPLRRSRRTGFVLALHPTGTVSRPEGVKEILDALDPYPVFDPEMLELTKWISEYYFCPWGEVLRSALPAGIHTETQRRIVLREPRQGGLFEDSVSLDPPNAEILQLLSEKGQTGFRELRRLVGPSDLYARVRELERRGLVEIRHELKRPKVSVRRERMVRLVFEDRRELGLQIEALSKRAPKGARCLQLLSESGGILSASQLRDVGMRADVIRRLKAHGFVETFEEERVRDPFANIEPEAPEDFVLTDAQQDAFRQIAEGIDERTFRTVLLHGVTGSGKTLVYIHAIMKVLAAGKGAIVLVPEISLTPQAVRRFRSHFGDNVAVLHSNLSQGERYDAWRALRRGERRIAIGARSAIFAPVSDLGLIVVDEEHDSSYKQREPDPKYNARDVALMRGKIAGAVVILGSATPSLESYHNTQIGKFHLCRLPGRIEDRPMPAVEIVDRRGGRRGILSEALWVRIAGRLERGERIILLQNRRGYSHFIQCEDCGFTPRCRRCQVTLTYHMAAYSMICHYCGVRQRPLSKCPECDGTNLRRSGAGTQRVEEVLKEQFPGIRVLRMDVDTTRHKGAYDRLLESFRKGEADVLLGTQMVSKGLDFPGVTLVGVISADTGLNLPDFRAGERTFQLLTQVAGRAGRGALPGEVIIQTHTPGDEAIRCAKTHHFLAFSETEMENRRELGYPPFGRLILLLFLGREEPQVSEVAREWALFLRRANMEEINVLGPAQAPLGKIKDNYRWQVLLKGKGSGPMHHLVRDARETLWKAARDRGVRVSVDVDPMDML